MQSFPYWTACRSVLCSQKERPRAPVAKQIAVSHTSVLSFCRLQRGPCCTVTFTWKLCSRITIRQWKMRARGSSEIGFGVARGHPQRSTFRIAPLLPKVSSVSQEFVFRLLFPTHTLPLGSLDSTCIKNHFYSPSNQKPQC